MKLPPSSDQVAKDHCMSADVQKEEQDEVIVSKRRDETKSQATRPLEAFVVALVAWTAEAERPAVGKLLRSSPRRLTKGQCRLP
jgi:hypothetical protein